MAKPLKIYFISYFCKACYISLDIRLDLKEHYATRKVKKYHESIPCSLFAVLKYIFGIKKEVKSTYIQIAHSFFCVHIVI